VYQRILVGDGFTVTAHPILPGASVRNPSASAVEQIIRCIAAEAGVECALPTPDSLPWGASVVHTLSDGVDEWAMHEPLRAGGRRSAAVLARVRAVGADADPSWFPTDGLVHLDLHTDNILVGSDGMLTGIIDWEGACAGDHRFDLVTIAYDLDGHDQPVWDLVEATGIQPRVLRAYVAHHALRFTSWQIRHHPADVARQLDRAERVLDRYGA
jgi:aminoglycoside phosphotransferase (APT) family kinase protein